MVVALGSTPNCNGTHSKFFMRHYVVQIDCILKCMRPHWLISDFHRASSFLQTGPHSWWCFLQHHSGTWHSHHSSWCLVPWLEALSGTHLSNRCHYQYFKNRLADQHPKPFAWIIWLFQLQCSQLATQHRETWKKHHRRLCLLCIPPSDQFQNGLADICPSLLLWTGHYRWPNLALLHL